MFTRFLPKTTLYRLVFTISITILIVFTIYSFGLSDGRKSRAAKVAHMPNRVEDQLYTKASNTPQPRRTSSLGASDRHASSIRTSSISSSTSISTVSPTSSIHNSASLNSNSTITQTITEDGSYRSTNSTPPKTSKMLVVAGMKDQDYSWIHDELKGWESNVYYSDDDTAPYHTDIKKGRETAVYLAYILENYHDLHEVTVFVHATRVSWHNDFGLFREHRDLLPGLEHLRTEYIISQGYANLRCSVEPGCKPLSVPLNDAADDRESLKSFRKAFSHLHPESKLPDMIGAPCCAQFAVSRNQILARPRSDYERYHQWLKETDVSEWDAGWIFEYSWHIIFGRPSVDCQSMEEDCSCNLYSWCQRDKKPI